MISPIIAHQRRMIACAGSIVHRVVARPSQHGEKVWLSLSRKIE